MNILTTTDGSERSLDVLPHVARMASRLGGGVTILRVLNPLVDVDGRSTRVIAELVACLFDQKTRGRHDHSRTETRHGQHAA